MRAGDTFVLANRQIEGGHPHFVLCDPHDDKVVVASITGWEQSKDQSCILNAGDDGIVTKKSIVSYRDVKVVSNSFLDIQLAEGTIAPLQPLNQSTIQKVLRGCAVTKMIPTDALDLLEQLGLVPVF